MTANATPSKATVPPRAGRSGFTMVEMLTVIGIIVILMAILLPVIGKIRLQVKIADTQNEISKISGAIEQYYAEFKVYPGPVSNSVITSGYAMPGAGGNITMTENMVIALCGGPEIQGTSISYVSNDLASSLGPVNLNPNPAKQSRHPAFIDATPGQRMPDLPWDNGNGKTGVSDSYIPEFLDRFTPRFGSNYSRPILYMRALVGNPASAGNKPVNGQNVPVICGTDDQATQYNYNHILLPYGKGLDFQFPSNGNTNTTPNDKNGNPIPDAAYYYSDWNTYLHNTSLPATPRGVNGYILISAGPDNIFGTIDDILYP